MNEQDIDELAGRELDAAVAVKLGWRWMQPPMVIGIALYTEDEIAAHDLIEPRTIARLEMWDEGVPAYSTDIAAAWELDGAGWSWSFDEGVFYVRGYGLVPALSACVNTGRAIQQVVVVLADFSTKAAATATARCQAWLKAKQTEREAR